MFRAAIVALGLFAVPAFAAHYEAKPAERPSAEKIVLRDLMWKCGDAGCAAGKSASRPAIVCAVLAREVGRLESFTVAGRPLDPASLEKCNARAQ